MWGHADAYAESLLGVFGADLDHLGVIGQAEGHRCVPLRTIRGLITRLALDLGEVGGGDVDRGKGCAFLCAKICLAREGGHHDDPHGLGILSFSHP